jgi:hypothetical protein
MGSASAVFGSRIVLVFVATLVIVLNLMSKKQPFHEYSCKTEYLRFSQHTEDSVEELEMKFKSLFFLLKWLFCKGRD